jgi:secondary thiamine-phosphate synthase enzyme
MAVKSISISLQTRGSADVTDITGKVNQVLQESSLKDGILTIFCPSSTSALTTLEYEPGAVSDLQRFFDEVINPNRHYEHNAAWGDGNGHSHVRAALLGPSLTIPFVDRRLTMGTWQQVIYIDFDNRARHRSLVVQILGE